MLKFSLQRFVFCLLLIAAARVSARGNEAVQAEKIRSECIEGRRYVCGRVLQIVKEGIVVDSGYPSLLQPPLNHSWLTRANVAPTRPAALVEGKEPDSIAVGLVFLTDLPRRPAVHPYDYVALHGYPAGHYDYVPVAGISKTIRRFSGGLETAVRLNLEAAQPAPRRAPAAYLRMPSRADGSFPPLLSQTGAFQDVRQLIPAEGLIPYELNISFWSDGASKRRWLSLPEGGIGFAARGEWKFPDGTVFVKQFELATNESQPEQRRRLETRLLVRAAGGSVYGATYKWRADNSDADLLSTNLSENIVIQTPHGTRNQSWYYPSREDCRTCHTDRAGGVLGVKARQFNPVLLRSWNHQGLFNPPLTDAALADCQFLAGPSDTSRSLEDRARSYLDVNCSNCHRPGGTVAYFDARFDTPLDKQGLIDGPVLIDEGIDHARIISPNDPWRSILFMRADTTEAFKMPPLARQTIDQNGMDVLRQWIDSLPGRHTLAPPDFSRPAGNYPAAIDIKLAQPEPGAEIHYTIDGSIPGATDPVYQGPIHLAASTTVRAKAFKTGCTRSITSQETFIIGE
ncbi:MAG TPA: chitobiase/beta-hexosaminidase C-terminal domain-containing protein [Verrucomicrobiae bacterium]